MPSDGLPSVSNNHDIVIQAFGSPYRVSKTMDLFSVHLKSEMLFGTLFVLWGVVSIVFNKRGGKWYAAFQKGWGLGKSAFSVGRFISVFGGLMFVIIGLIMIFVLRR